MDVDYYFYSACDQMVMLNCMICFFYFVFFLDAEQCSEASFRYAHERRGAELFDDRRAEDPQRRRGD